MQNDSTSDPSTTPPLASESSLVNQIIEPLQPDYPLVEQLPSVQHAQPTQQVEADWRQQDPHQLLLEFAQLGSWDWNLLTGAMLWNDQTYRILGLVPQVAPTQQTWRDRIHPDDVIRIEQRIAQSLQTETTFEEEYRLIHPDGSIHWVWSKGRGLYPAQGEPPVRMLGVIQDITRRKLAEQAEQASLRQLLNTLESISDAFFSLDRNWRFTYLNSQAVRLLQRHADELNGRNVWDEFPDAVGSVFDREYHRAINEQITVDFEAFYPPLHAWYAVRAYPTSEGLAVYFQDITERKSSEALTQQSLAEINTIYASAPIGLCFVDTELRFVRINDRLAAINGVSAANHIGRTLRDVLPDMAERLEPLYQQVIQTGTPLEDLEVRGSNPAQPGVERDWLLTLYPLKTASGKVLGVNVMVYEITDRKQAEAALAQSNDILQAVIEGTSDVVFVKDTQGRYRIVNSTAAEWLNTTTEAMLGNDDTALFPLDVAKHIMQIDQQVMQTGESITYEENVPKQGRLRSLSSTKYPWRDQQGNILGVIGISRDISELAEGNARLALLNDELVRANRIKDEFLAVLSHELRSPLNPILGWTKLLQTGRLNAKQTTEALQTIERNAKVQTQIIDDLLDIAGILRGKLSLTNDSVDLKQVILAAINTVQLAANAKLIHLDAIFAPYVEPVNGDAARLQQIVWNLLSNAVKFTPQGGRVTISLMQIGSEAQIQVMDTGKGIAPDFLPYVFDFFRQADSTITRQFGGLGLGLAIVKQLVESHGGTVTAASPGEGQGATFTVRLPIRAASLESPLTSPVAHSASDLRNIRVLVVDDNPDSRDLIVFVLEQQGATVTAVSSATEALQVFEQSTPDILISDIGMPQIDGYRLIRFIRQLPKGRQIPAIALTAYAGETNQEQARRAGFGWHLAKPIAPSALIELVARVKNGN